MKTCTNVRGIGRDDKCTGTNGDQTWVCWECLILFEMLLEINIYVQLLEKELIIFFIFLFLFFLDNLYASLKKNFLLFMEVNEKCKGSLFLDFCR